MAENYLLDRQFELMEKQTGNDNLRRDQFQQAQAIAISIAANTPRTCRRCRNPPALSPMTSGHGAMGNTHGTESSGRGDGSGGSESKVAAERSGPMQVGFMGIDALAKHFHVPDVKREALRKHFNVFGRNTLRTVTPTSSTTRRAGMKRDTYTTPPALLR